MKSFIKKAMVAAVLLAVAVDWPVEIDSRGRAARGRAARGKYATHSLLESCFESLRNSTQTAERSVNKATQVMGKETKSTKAESVQEDHRHGRRIVIGAASSQNHSNAQPTSMQQHMVSCPLCNGKGCILGSDGSTYRCSRCGGKGKVSIAPSR